MKVSPELGGSTIIKADTPSIGEVYELFQSYLKKHKIGETKFGWRFKINEIKLDKLCQSGASHQKISWLNTYQFYLILILRT